MQTPVSHGLRGLRISSIVVSPDGRLRTTAKLTPNVALDMSDDFLKGFKAGFEAALEATSAQKARREEKIEYLLAEKQKAKEWAIGKGFLKAAIGIPMPANNEFVLSEKLKAKLMGV